jgi:hypothetical protein
MSSCLAECPKRYRLGRRFEAVEINEQAGSALKRQPKRSLDSPAGRIVVRLPLKRLDIEQRAVREPPSESAGLGVELDCFNPPSDISPVGSADT